MKKLILMMLASLSLFVFADGHESAPMSTDGAFSTLQVASPDIEKYRQALIDNPSAFQATGATAAGICVTNSGHEYLGQMMVWSAFPNVAAALSGSTMYDPQKAPRSFERLREVKYGVTWKPITPFRLEPGFERVQRIKVSAENMQAFTAAIDNLEKAIQDAGYENFYNGAFVLIGGGDRDVGTVIVRSIVRDANAMGVLFDEYFAGNASWADEYQTVTSLGEVVSDNIEVCEQLYFGS
jgi:hypothetical protein|tara:strand:- start:320 stop:1036 length:717 start_codon:yes stop_codon:yes gene_type:complete